MDRKGSSEFHRDFSLRTPRGTTHVLSNASFIAMDGKGRFDFAIWFNGSWVHACSLDGYKVSSPKEAEVRTI